MTNNSWQRKPIWFLVGWDRVELCGCKTVFSAEFTAMQHLQLQERVLQLN